jgi:hypothetical protein
LICSSLAVFLVILPVSFGCRKVEKEYYYFWNKVDTPFTIKLEGAESEGIYVEVSGLTGEQLVPMIDKIGKLYGEIQPDSNEGIKISFSSQDLKDKVKSEEVDQEVIDK